MLLAACTLLPDHTLAQQWEVEPSLELVATYTDNLFLGVEGTEVGSAVGQVNPGLRLRKDEGRLTGDLRYRLQSIFFAEDSDFNTTFHQLNATATLEVARERLFVDVDGSIEQFVVDPRQPIPTSNILAIQNLGDVGIANVNPYFIQRLGSSELFVRLDYVRGIGRYDGFGIDTFSRVDDFERDTAGFYLGTDQSETGFEWSATYDYDYIDYETLPDYRYDTARLGLAIPLGRSLRLVAFGGAETDLLITRAEGGLDSEFWEAGFRLDFGRGNEIELRTGERFFGTSHFGRILFEGRRLTMSVQYSENPTTSALGGDPGSLIIPFGVSGGQDPFDEPQVVDDLVIGPIRAEVYVSYLWMARIEFETGKSAVSLTYQDELRDFLDLPGNFGGDEDKQTSATFRYGYRLGARSELELTSLFGRYDFAQTDVVSDVTEVRFAYIRQLAGDSEWRVTYRFTTQENTGVADFDTYDEHAVDLGFIKRF